RQGYREVRWRRPRRRSDDIPSSAASEASSANAGTPGPGTGTALPPGGAAAHDPLANAWNVTALDDGIVIAPAVVWRLTNWLSAKGASPTSGPSAVSAVQVANAGSAKSSRSLPGRAKPAAELDWLLNNCVASVTVKVPMPAPVIVVDEAGAS